MGNQGIRIGKRLTPPSDEDWRRLVAAIARYMPGIGDPMALPLPELEAWGAAISGILQRETSGPAEASDHRARVEADMRRLHG